MKYWRLCRDKKLQELSVAAAAAAWRKTERTAAVNAWLETQNTDSCYPVFNARSIICLPCDIVYISSSNAYNLTSERCTVIWTHLLTRSLCYALELMSSSDAYAVVVLYYEGELMTKFILYHASFSKKSLQLCRSLSSLFPEIYNTFLPLDYNTHNFLAVFTKTGCSPRDEPFKTFWRNKWSPSNSTAWSLFESKLLKQTEAIWMWVITKKQKFQLQYFCRKVLDPI